jgi:hypothetical protein
MRIFIIITVVGLFVSVVLHLYTKKYPVLAVQLSILATLFIYPLANMYLAIARGSMDALDTINPEYLSFEPLVFFMPVPVCVLVAVVFVIVRRANITGISFSSIVDLSKVRIEITTLFLALITGSLWLTLSMFFQKSDSQLALIKYFLYTLFGFGMYLISNLVIFITKWLIANCTKK